MPRKMKAESAPKDPSTGPGRGAYALIARHIEDTESAPRSHIFAARPSTDEASPQNESAEFHDLSLTHPALPASEADPSSPVAAEKALLRKLDARLLPILTTMLLLNTLDRNGLPTARLQGLEASLALKDAQFNTAISVFFAGYIALQVPSNLLLTRLRPSRYLPGCMMLWGLLSGSTALVTGFRGLVLVRFLLGVVEAPFFPGALFVLSSWYTKRELALRMSLMYAGSLVAGAIGGFVGAGVEAFLHGVAGWESWQWLFVLESCVTVLVALVAAMVLPDYPATTRWLGPEERELAVLRLQGSMERDHGLRKAGLARGLGDALTDSKVYLLAGIILTKTSAGAVTSFIPTLIGTFNLPRITTLLLIAPPYLVAALASLLVSRSSDIRSERSFHIIVPISLGMAGFALFAMSVAPLPRYFSLFLMLAGVYGSYNVALAWIGTTIPEPIEKRSAAIAIINTVGNCAQIYSPYLYLARNGPRYTGAMVTNSGFCLACVSLVWVLRVRLKRENERFVRKGAGYAL